MSIKKEESHANADYVCMEEAVKAFEKLSRHYCGVRDGDSVAVKQATLARMRVLQWLGHFIEDHPYL
uniref:Uncharacterized protein n=1 Tax=viral metagenome TaxID=1070528 RepID=A0A6M3JBP7_9ZZZZ